MEEFPDWVDLIALGALVVQGVVQGTLWTRYGLVTVAHQDLRSSSSNFGNFVILPAIRRASSRVMFGTGIGLAVIEWLSAPLFQPSIDH